MFALLNPVIWIESYCFYKYNANPPESKTM